MGRLIQLELNDFKSYAGHIVIGPFDPFTSVIGPNGSGKSNLMDAISFVLGVASNKLRSSNLGELVHRGASAEGGGKQKGAKKNIAQNASVSALYEKDDETRLQFTRTVTLKGQSEYFINNQSIAYAEYNKVLESENILIKARNFLVFQGDVESIASKSPKELTRLLEQISGSEAFREEYDRLREEHEQAVESSTFAFNKRRGLSAEIKAVQEQKEDVVRFEELLGQRQDLMSELAMIQLRTVEDKAKLLADNIDSKQSILESLEKEHALTEKAFKDSRKDRARIMKELLNAEKKLKKVAEEAEKGSPELIVLKERIKTLEKKIGDNLAAHERLSIEKDRLVKEQNVIKKELIVLESAKASKEQELKTQLTIIPPKHQSEYNQLREEVDRQSAKERLKLDNLERKIAPQQLAKGQIECKLDELNLRKGQLSQDFSIVSNRLLEIQRLYAENSAQLYTINDRLTAKQTRRRKIADDEAEMADKLREVAEKLLELKSIEEESERQLKTRESVESLKRIFPGVHGSFMNIVQPTARRYEEALSAVIGMNADAIVVDHERIAMECVRYLKEQRISPMTFLPLDSLVLPSGVDRLRHDLPDGVRLAADLLRPSIDDPSVLKAIQYVCGTTIVSESLQMGRSAIQSHSSIYRAVTIEAHVVNRIGYLTGGTLRSKSSKWEEREVRLLKEQRDQLLSAIGELSKEARKLDAEERHSNDRIDIEERLKYIETERIENERKKQGVQDQLEFFAEEISAKQEELSEIDASCSKTIKEIESINEKISSIAQTVYAPFTKKTGIAVSDDQSSHISKQISETRAEFAFIMNKFQSQLSVIVHSTEKCENELQDISATLQESESLLEQSREGLMSVEAKQKIDVSKTESSSAEINNIKSRMDSVDIDSLKKAVADTLSRKNAANRDLSMAEMEIEQMLRERDSILSRCNMEQIYLPLLKGSLSDTSFQNIIVDYSKLPKKSKNTALKLQEIQEEIDNLAPNLRALDKLEGAEQRLRHAMDSFEKQRSDAKRARDAFQKVKQQRYDLFAPCFKHVSEAIDLIYKSLTSADQQSPGTAYLSLEDSEEPYIEGIRFHACPPGKRFLDMESLSGGERTMAALSLLFALHSYLPAPFFILDEVDAALDNANVGRLASYIKQMSSNHTQMLVISLKAALYEHADALVGVYRTGMVSQPLTLRLTDYDQPHDAKTRILSNEAENVHINNIRSQ